MPTLTLVVLISGSGSNLQAIIDQIESGYLNAQIKCVISNRPGVYGLERAANHGIPHHTIDHKTYSTREAFDAELIKIIQPYQPDCIVLAGFMRILTAPFFHEFHYRILNIHPSLLPKYQGLHTHQRALDAKDKKHGISVHIATEELDSGPVIAQASFDIEPHDTTQTLQAKAHRFEHIIYPLVLHWLAQQNLQIQDNSIFYKGQLLNHPIQLETVDDSELPPK